MSFSGTRSSRDYTWPVFIAFTLISALFIHSRAYSTNEASRLASIDSLVNRGTWAIDGSIFDTVDRIKVGDHFYSSKPPILAFVGAGIYSVLHNIFGLTLQSTSCDPLRGPTQCRAVLELAQADWAYFILTLLLIALPGALIVVLIYRWARRHDFDQRASLILSLIVGVGTSIFPFSTVFTNHVPAAASALFSIYLLITSDEPNRSRLATAGFAAALSAAIDLSTGIFAIGAFIYTMLRYRSRVLWFIAGALVPVAITIVLDYQIVGNPFPPQTFTPGYDYAGSSLGTGVAGFQRAADVPFYIFNLLIGERGVLMFFPIILWYIFAAFHAGYSVDQKIRWMSRIVLTGSLAYLLYFGFSTDSFGGNGFSPRWLLNPIPLLALFSVTDRSIYRSIWRKILIGVIAAYSIVEAYTGALNPWTPSFPMLRVAYTALQPIRQPNVSLSGYSTINKVPSEIRGVFGTNNIVPRRFDAAHSFVIPTGVSWWFIDDSTPLAPEIAQPLGLSAATTVTLNADLYLPMQKWLDTFAHTASLDSGAPIQLPITFNNELVLLAYQIQSKPNKLTIVTAWRVSAQPKYQEQRKAFFDLVGSNDEVAQHNESLGVQYDTLQVGDTIFHVRTFPASSLPNENYTLQIGIVDPDTESRLMSDVGSDHIVVKLP